MILGQKPPIKLPLNGRKPQTISEWLEVVMWNLVPSAQARVRPEIEAHYAEAAQMHLSRGASEVEATAAALTDLGDAQAAAKRFRQEYLTTLEINDLRKQITDSRNTHLAISHLVILFCGFFTSLMSLVGWAFGFLANMQQFYFFTGPLLLTYLAFVLLDLVAIVLARRKPTMRLARQFSLLGTIRRLNVCFMSVALSINLIIGNFLPWSSLFPFFFSCLIKTFFGVSIFANLMLAVRESQRDSRLRKKLASASEDDLPPPHSSMA